jgi:hypothetical protein
MTALNPGLRFVAPFVLLAAIIGLMILSPALPGILGGGAGLPVPPGTGGNLSAQGPSSGLGPHAPGAVIVAAADSPRDQRTRADFRCDGVEDQNQIAEALAAAGPNGEVVLAEGRFNIDEEIVIPPSSALMGQGDRTVLNFLRGSISVNASSCSLSGFTFTGSGHITVHNARNVELRDITAFELDNEAIAAFKLDGYGGFVEDVILANCRAVDCDRWGFVIAGSYFENVPGIVRKVLFVDCEAINCGRYGQYYGSTEEGWDVGFSIESSAVEEITFLRCLASGSWESGFHVEDVPCTAVVLQDCISRDNGQKYRTGAHSPDFYAGYVVTAGMKLVNCTSENNVRGFYCNNRGGELIGCTDRGSEEGYVILRQFEGLRISDCAAINSGQPVNIWTGATRDIVIDAISISSDQGRPASAISVARTAKNPGEILIRNSEIRGYRVGVSNMAGSGGLVRVENTRVTGAETDFINCDVTPPPPASGGMLPWT